MCFINRILNHKSMHCVPNMQNNISCNYPQFKPDVYGGMYMKQGSLTIYIQRIFAQKRADPRNEKQKSNFSSKST